jgi:ABC-type antimicrobial peptide transport system permease subunit
MERVVADNIQAPRFRATLVGAFAVVGVILAILGVASVITYAVSHRVREFGIRMAVGADARSLIRLVVGDGIRLTAVGLVVGLAAAAAVARLLQGLLFGVSSLDPAVFLGAPALLVMAAFLASYVPARRVGRIDPVKALRTE